MGLETSAYPLPYTWVRYRLVHIDMVVTVQKLSHVYFMRVFLYIETE